MSLRMPESMDECIYFTRRKFDTNNGKIIAWVYKKNCPECGEKMGKPLDEKTGRPKIRADTYECPACNEPVCKSCTAVCKECEETFCKDCLTEEGLCQNCEENRKENSDEEQESESKKPEACPAVQSDSVGEAALHA